LSQYDEFATEARAARPCQPHIIFFLLIAILSHFAFASDAAKDAEKGVTTEVALNALPNPAAPAAAAPSSDTRLFLEVQINGRPTGKVGEFVLRRNKLMARPSELHDIGLQVPLSRASETDALISLSDLPGVTWTLDAANQILKITATNNALLPTLLLPMGSNLEGNQRVIESGTGITLNHDIVGSYAGGETGASGSFDLRAFSRFGIVSSDWLAYAGTTPGHLGGNNAIRLDTAYTFADVNSLRRYSLGDFISSNLSWTRSVHLEGVQLRSDFSMRPDLVTMPLPRIASAAAVPSTVNVLADGSMAVSQRVDAGPFEIQQLPVVSGAGTISMSVTNALGQQVTVSQPFYASSTLLAPGLQTYAGEMGLVRRNWGSISNDYGKMAGSASYRRGLTRAFTIEGSAEGTDGAFLAGGGGVMQIGHFGVLNFAASPSIASGRTGAQLSAGAERIGRMFSLGTSALFATRDYRDVASMNGSGVLRRQLSAFTGLNTRRFGSLGLAYVDLKQDPSIFPDPVDVQLAGNSRVVTASYSVQIHRVSCYSSWFKNFGVTGKGSNGLQIGMTFSFGKYRTASAGAGSDASWQAQVQQAAPQVGDWGYQFYTSGGDSTHAFAQGQYKSQVGLFTAGVDRDNGLTSLRMESQSAVSLVDKAVFASNEIYDSFAVVDTRPVANVSVYQENRKVGTTGKTGRVLVPDMRAFDLNNISIEPTDIPGDATLGTDKREVRPQDRSGVIVKFPIRFSHSALLRIVDEAGVVVPQGSAATLRATGVVVPVGYDGEAYVDDLSPNNDLIVEYPDGKRCTASFDYHPIPGDIPSIGPLRCQRVQP